LKKFSGGYTPKPPLNRGGRTRGGKERERRGRKIRKGEGEGKGRKRREGNGVPHFNLVPQRFPWAIAIALVETWVFETEPSRDLKILDTEPRSRPRHVKNVSRGVSSRDSSFEDHASLGTTTDSISIINL
jgi:hypothetical protein